MTRIGLIAGSIALIVLFFLTLLPTVMGYHNSDACISLCQTSVNLFGGAGYILPITTITVAGLLIGTLYLQNRKKNEVEELDYETRTCEYCGKQVEADWRLCPFCGQSIVTPAGQ